MAYYSRSFSDTSSKIDTNESIDSSGLLNASNQEFREMGRLIQDQKQNFLQTQKNIEYSNKLSNDWMSNQLITLTKIREAQFETKKSEFQQIQNDHELEITNKQLELESEIRNLQHQLIEINSAIQETEYEFAEEKEKGGKELLSYRTQILHQFSDLETKHASHSEEIGELQAALRNLKSHQRKNLLKLREEKEENDALLQDQVNNLKEACERTRREINQSEEIHNKKTMEANLTIELLKSEIESSKERTSAINKEIENCQKDLNRSQRDLMEIQEAVHSVQNQIQYHDEQKKVLKDEIAKLDKLSWKLKKTKYFYE